MILEKNMQNFPVGKEARFKMFAYFPNAVSFPYI